MNVETIDNGRIALNACFDEEQVFVTGLTISVKKGKNSICVALNKEQVVKLQAKLQKLSEMIVEEDSYK